jgi:transcriptional regulator with XRE-family HTH domain
MDEERRIHSWAQDPRFVPSIGRTIKVLRTDRGLDRKDLAEEVGISYSYLTEIENGNKPPSSTVLAAIAAALDVQLHELIAGAEERVQREALREEELMPSSDARRVNQLRTYAGTWADPPQDSAPSLPGPAYRRGRPPRPRAPEASTLWELQDLLERLSPEDVQRVLDLARRLAR